MLLILLFLCVCFFFSLFLSLIRSLSRYSLLLFREKNNLCSHISIYRAHTTYFFDNLLTGNCLQPIEWTADLLHFFSPLYSLWLAICRIQLIFLRIVFVCTSLYLYLSVCERGFFVYWIVCLPCVRQISTDRLCMCVTLLNFAMSDIELDAVTRFPWNFIKYIRWKRHGFGNI